ncbi:MAG: hypothetical protein IPP12_22390 [Nitrospira sp.]|nr:hypothetical protein [Nitrospira sp.]
MNRIVLVVATVFVAIAMAMALALALAYLSGKSQATQAKADLEAANNTIAATNSNLDLSRAEVRALDEALRTAERERDDTKHELTLCQLKHIGSFIDEQCCKLLRGKNKQ